MPEQNQEVIIDSHVFPDTVTVTLSNDDFIDSRDYVSKELYESVCAANDAWQLEGHACRSDKVVEPKILGGERMTPTEEICARLDELGVEYDTYDLPNGEHGLSWIDGNSIEWEVVQQGENFRIHALQLVTTEQAIAATAGAGTCELINAADDLGEGTSSCMCSKCGYTAIDDWWDEFKYCPSCGRRIEVDA